MCSNALFPLKVNSIYMLKVSVKTSKEQCLNFYVCQSDRVLSTLTDENRLNYVILMGW